MSKPEWGTKRLCPKCNAKFYDMKRQPIICPKCETTFETDDFTKKRRGRPPASETKKPSDTEEREIDIELSEDITSFEENDEVLEDTSDFGEDDKVVDIEKSSDED